MCSGPKMGTERTDSPDPRTVMIGEATGRMLSSPGQPEVAPSQPGLSDSSLLLKWSPFKTCAQGVMQAGHDMQAVMQ